VKTTEAHAQFCQDFIEAMNSRKSQASSETCHELRTQVGDLRDALRIASAALAAERARLDDLVADLNDACITLASAKDDCDDYALLNTGFKLTAVRDVLLQYIPNAAIKEGAK